MLVLPIRIRRRVIKFLLGCTIVSISVCLSPNIPQISRVFTHLPPRQLNSFYAIQVQPMLRQYRTFYFTKMICKYVVLHMRLILKRVGRRQRRMRRGTYRILRHSVLGNYRTPVAQVYQPTGQILNGKWPMPPNMVDGSAVVTTSRTVHQ